MRLLCVIACCWATLQLLSPSAFAQKGSSPANDVKVTELENLSRKLVARLATQGSVAEALDTPDEGREAGICGARLSGSRNSQPIPNSASWFWTGD